MTGIFARCRVKFSCIGSFNKTNFERTHRLVLAHTCWNHKSPWIRLDPELACSCNPVLHETGWSRCTCKDKMKILISWGHQSGISKSTWFDFSDTENYSLCTRINFRFVVMQLLEWRTRATIEASHRIHDCYENIDFLFLLYGDGQRCFQILESVTRLKRNNWNQWRDSTWRSVSTKI